MAMGSRQITEKSLSLIRSLPRISLGNIRDNPGSKITQKRGRGQHGGDKHGAEYPMSHITKDIITEDNIHQFHY
ncbi:unnamed protein product, partial [Iphiclides podalirius]